MTLAVSVSMRALEAFLGVGGLAFSAYGESRHRARTMHHEKKGKRELTKATPRNSRSLQPLHGAQASSVPSRNQPADPRPRLLAAVHCVPRTGAAIPAPARQRARPPGRGGPQRRLLPRRLHRPGRLPRQPHLLHGVGVLRRTRRRRLCGGAVLRLGRDSLPLRTAELPAHTDAQDGRAGTEAADGAGGVMKLQRLWARPPLPKKRGGRVRGGRRCEHSAGRERLLDRMHPSHPARTHQRSRDSRASIEP